MRRLKSKLPEKLSGVILVALEDLARVERSKLYIVDMQNWHWPDPEIGKCSVCFAGSVIAMRDGLTHEHYGVPDMFNNHTQRRLSALNMVRTGSVREALHRMAKGGYWMPRNEEQDDEVHALSLTYSGVDYHNNKRGFKIAMRTIARRLAKVGL